MEAEKGFIDDTMLSLTEELAVHFRTTLNVNSGYHLDDMNFVVLIKFFGLHAPTESTLGLI